MAKEPEPKTEVLAETEQFLAWKADEPDEEMTYHLELNNVTVHFFQEEWEEFLTLVSDAEETEEDPDLIYDLEFSNLVIHFTAEEWSEFLELVQLLPKGK
jgi:cell fate regulator YaaT (PSP1 superfamily)